MKYLYRVYKMASISLKMSEIEMMRGNLLALNDFVYKNRFNMQQDDGRQLMNHFNYALDILSTMANKLSIQLTEACYSPSCYTDGVTKPYGKTLLYDLNNSGRTVIVSPATLPRTTDGWERQFDDKLLLNPPCYTIPPQNLTNIQKIRHASEANRLQSL